MNEVDILGFIGVLLILVAYFLNVNGRLDSRHLSYILLNLIGSMLACLASVLLAYYPFVILEGTWAVISALALFKYFHND